MSIKSIIKIKSGRHEDAGQRPVWVDLMVLAGVVLLLTLPFINKAFDWDDREFIEFAQVQSQHPLQLHLENLSYKGQFFEQFRTSHPPVLSEYLALFLRIGFSMSEPLAHGAYLIFPLIAAVSMYFLARRFCGYPLVTALLLVFSMGFMVTSHSIMGDVPGVAVWLAATALYVWGADSGDWRLLTGAGLAMAMGTMIAYQALSLVPLLFLYALMKKKIRLRTLLPFLAPIAVFGAYFIFTRFKYHGAPVLSYRVGLRFGWINLDLKFRAVLSFIGISILAPFAYIAFFRRKWDVLLGFILLPPLLTWAVIYYLGKGDLSVWEAVQLSVAVSGGFAIFYGFTRHCAAGIYNWFKRRQPWSDFLFLYIWFAGIVAYVMVFLPFVTVRYLLPLFPPVILLFMREASTLWRSRPNVRNYFILAVALVTLLGSLITAVADYRFAGAYRSLSAGLANQYGNRGTGWVLSEFGIRYYMQQHGFKYLGPLAPGVPDAKKGDIVVVSDVESFQVVGSLPEGSYRILKNIDVKDSLPVRLLNLKAGAGFYSHLVGPLPIAISREPVDRITVYELYWEGGDN